MDDIFEQGETRKFKGLAVFVGMLVYTGGMVAYSGTHNIHLMLRGVPGDLVLWAIVGVISLELTAIGLPLALHFWCHDPTQRMWAFIFYGVDITFIMLNVIADFSVVSNTTADMPGWVRLYLEWGAPASPVVSAVIWSVLFLLDPYQKERAKNERLAAELRSKLVDQRARTAMQDIEARGMIERAGRDGGLRMVETVTRNPSRPKRHTVTPERKKAVTDFFTLRPLRQSSNGENRNGSNDHHEP
jgi:hypothetical protein